MLIELNLAEIDIVRDEKLSKCAVSQLVLIHGVLDGENLCLPLQEQAVEREQEREDFQKELARLQVSLREKERQENQEHRLQREVWVITHSQFGL